MVSYFLPHEIWTRLGLRTRNLGTGIITVIMSCHNAYLRKRSLLCMYVGGGKHTHRDSVFSRTYVITFSLPPPPTYLLIFNPEK